MVDTRVKTKKKKNWYKIKKVERKKEENPKSQKYCHSKRKGDY